MSLNRLSKIIQADTDLIEVERSGMIYFAEKDDPEGLCHLGIFSWSNPKIAEKRGIPGGYYVFCFSNTDRRILPFFEKGETVRRPWSEIEKEFREVLLPIIQTKEIEDRFEKVANLPSRYRIES